MCYISNHNMSRNYNTLNNKQCMCNVDTNMYILSKKTSNIKIDRTTQKYIGDRQMSMSTGILFFREEKDDAHQKKVSVLRACLAAGISLPPEINKYFDGTNDENYPLQIEVKTAISEWSKEGCAGLDVDIDKLPEGIKTIRFYNSW